MTSAIAARNRSRMRTYAWRSVSSRAAWATNSARVAGQSGGLRISVDHETPHGASGLFERRVVEQHARVRRDPSLVVRVEEREVQASW